MTLPIDTKRLAQLEAQLEAAYAESRKIRAIVDAAALRVANFRLYGNEAPVFSHPLDTSTYSLNK